MNVFDHNTLLVFVLLAAIADGLLAGMAVDRVVVHFPARRKIGTLAYADYARVTDMCNGFFVYPVLAIGGNLVKIFTLVLALYAKTPGLVLILIGLATVFGALALVTTRFAAPTMLLIGRTENREELISPLLERFVRFSYARAIFIWLEFAVLMWLLVVL